MQSNGSFNNNIESKEKVSNNIESKEKVIALDVDSFFNENMDLISFLTKAKIDENEEIKNLFIDEIRKLLSKKEDFLLLLYVLSSDNDEKNELIFKDLLVNKNLEYINLLKDFMLKKVKIFIINKNKNKKSFIFNYKALKKAINDFLSDKKNIEDESFKNELLKIKTIFEGDENLTICHLDDLNCRLFYIYSFLENIKKEIKELKSGNISSSENTVNIDIQELEKEIEKVENLIDSNSTEIKNEINTAF
jgi:hypothetical protein